MWSFLQFLIEGPPKPGNQLFHKDLGIPASLQRIPYGLRLNYNWRPHSLEAAHDDELQYRITINLPPVVPATAVLIEVEANHGRPVKWVLRMPLPGTGRDLVVVCVPDGKVMTVWTNASSDTHASLKRSIYTLPSGFEDH